MQLNRVAKKKSFIIPPLIERSGECLGKDKSTMTRRSAESFFGTVFRGDTVVSTSSGDVVKGPITEPAANSLFKKIYRTAIT